jgi:hypothetical protein
VAFAPAVNLVTLGHALKAISKPWTIEPIPSGYRVIDGNGFVLARVYGQPSGTIAASDTSVPPEQFQP